MCDIRTKMNCDIFSEFLFSKFSDIILTSLFPEQLKYADIKPLFKKDSRNDKINHRSVSILWKIFIQTTKNLLWIYLTSVWVWIPMIKKWRESLDLGGNFGALLTDLSKAFDCLSHDLCLAKLRANELDMPSLKLLFSYLKKRRQRAKINTTYSSWSEIRFEVPLGPILGPLLFNIFMCALFLFVPDIGIAAYAGDNTPHATNKILKLY